MKIAYYTSNRTIFPPGPEDFAASSSILADLVQNLKPDHDITVYAPVGSKMDGVEIIDLGFKNFAIDSSLSSIDWTTKSVIGMKQIFLGKILEDADKYDIIHLQTEPVYLGMPFVSLTKTPVLFTPHHPFYESDRPIYSYYDGKINMSALSKYQASKFPMKQQIPVVYNGVQIDNYQFQENSDGYYLYFGRFTKDKGVEEFIELAKSTRNQQFVIAGAGALEAKVKDAANELSNLEYRGYLAKGSNEWAKTLSSAKALIMPTIGEESFGMVIIEAMAFGTPVIAYDKCAAPEIIEDKKSGFVTSQNHVIQLANIINEVDSMKGLDYQNMRRNARTRIENEFTSKIMSEHYEDLYKKVISKS